jgi:hypothetical protein
VIEAGRVAELGTPRDLLQDPGSKFTALVRSMPNGPAPRAANNRGA